MVRTTLQAEVSKTAAFNGAGVSISSKANPSSVLLNVKSLTADAVAIFQIQTSNDAFATDTRVEKTINVKGPFATTYPIGRVFANYDMPGLRVGTASCTMRIALTYLSAGTVVYESFLTTGA